VAGSAALRNGLVDSAIGTPNSVGYPEDAAASHDEQQQQQQQQRPKPYPTYSRYLIGTQNSTPRSNGSEQPEEAGKAVREWLDHSHQHAHGGEEAMEGDASAEDDERHAVTVRAQGVGQSVGSRERTHRPSFGLSPIHHRLRAWHGNSKHSWDDRAQDFGDEDEADGMVDEDRGIYESSSSADVSDEPADGK